MLCAAVPLALAESLPRFEPAPCRVFFKPAQYATNGIENNLEPENPLQQLHDVHAAALLLLLLARLTLPAATTLAA